MNIRFTNPDPRDFPTLGLSGVVAGDEHDLPIDIARDLVRQGVAVHVKPEEPAESAAVTKTDEKE